MTDQVLERFWDYVQVDSITGCWNWIGSKDRRGYGLCRMDAKIYGRYSHRVAYQVNKGAIPNGLELDHLCRNHACINPDHLEPVIHKENVLRGNAGSVNNNQLRKTHCPSGHPYYGDNLYIDPIGRRKCVACRKQQQKEWYQRLIKGGF